MSSLTASLIAATVFTGGGYAITCAKKLFTLAAVVMACAGPAFAQIDRPTGGCDYDPRTTGALPADLHGLYPPGERQDRSLDRVEVTPPEETWQEAQGNSERRRQEILACGVD